MKKGLLIGLGVFVILIILPICILWSHRNTMVTLDEKVNAQYISNQSNYDNMWKKFKELTQVTDIQAEKIKEIYDGLISGRYKDTDLLMKVVHEQNPELDQSTFKQLQNEIASSRNNFDNNQKQLTDIVREYNTYIRHNFITAKICNYNIKDTKDFIMTSERTENAFKNRKDDVIDLTN